MNLKKFNSDYSSPMLSEKRNQIGFVVLLAGIVLACSSSLYIPKESARISKEELRELAKGRATYINKCGSCHSLILPGKYNLEGWKVQVKRMAAKAHLTQQEEVEILNYVTKNDNSF